MNTNTSRTGRNSLSATLALALALLPLGEPVHAQLTDLSNLPIAAKVNAKPNILYTLDDSGSMVNTYLPDYVISAANPPNGYCRAGQATTPCTASFNFPPFLAADFNHLYYNPDITYSPPKKYDGTSYPDQDTLLSTGWTKVQNDPFLQPNWLPANVTNITAKVSVPVYCNSDFPLVGAAYVVGDVGDANGEYSATAGEHCRINGTKYDAINAAPAIEADYNYPWSPTAGVSAQYYYRNGGTKALYCDNTAPGWPRATTGGTCTFSCTLGGIYTPPTPVPQTCIDTGVAKTCCTGLNSPAGCGGASTYTPAGCNTSTFPQYCSPGIGLPGECTPGCSCNTRRTGESGKCSITNANCGCTDAPPGTPCTIIVSGDPRCPNATPAPTSANCSVGVLVTGCTGAAPNAACTDKVWDPIGKVYTATTLLQDSQLTNGGTGAVCRHNNFDYTSVGGPKAGPVTYPSGLFSKLVNSGCPTYASSITIPRHYYTIGTVQFCSAKNVTANAQWKGFGVAPCQPKNDLVTFLNVQYGPPAGSAAGTPAFTRVDLVVGRTFNYVDPYTGLAGTRLYAEEMTNYANWFSYYRTRILASKTTTAIAFSYLDSTFRVGFHGMNTPATNWVDVNDWMPGAGNQRDKWYTKLFSVAIGTGLTPSINAALRVGELFRTGTGGAGSMPAMQEGYIPAGATDPITVSCQKNYHILFTDGFTNQTKPPPVLSKIASVTGYATDDVDGAGNVPKGPGPNSPAASFPDYFPPDPGASAPTVTVAKLRSLALAAWPNPYVDPTPTANTLADIAMYYWMTDLRPTPLWGPKIAIDNVPSNDGTAGKDMLWTSDPAFWQHINFDAISFGSEGMLDASNAVTVTNNIAGGTAKWFTGINWPNPPESPGTPAANKGATAVDDLWHATVNARGIFVYAKDPLQVSFGLGKILAGVQNQQKTRAASAFSTDVLTLTDHAIYEPTILPGWAGNLTMVEINPKDGSFVSLDWDALTKLNDLLNDTDHTGVKATWFTTPPANDNLYPWYANRRIVTLDPTIVGPLKAVPFRFGSLNGTQLATLGSTPAAQNKVITYLRGGSYIHGVDSLGADINVLIEGTSIGQFRDRSQFGKLGDISDSSPLLVGSPNNPWSDVDDPGYQAYKDSYDPAAGGTPREPRIYVGANDGMLHVFNATQGSPPGKDPAGAEVFAYMPNAVFSSGVDEDGAPRGIQALTYQDGGAPLFKHHFYVNATARKQDVDFNNCGVAVGACSGDWHTIVVGGLGKGGGSYYAIDATVPVTTTDTETNIAKKVLWEFSDGDMLYSYSRPVIAKTYKDGWVVLVANGYNSVSGKGKIYMLNAKDGTLIRTLTTGASDPGTPANPSGLAQLNGFTEDFHNQFIEQVYAGDLNGNVWRWDLSKASAGFGATLFAKLVDPSGTPQPVTTAPQIEIDLNNGNDRWVFVGTGRLLHPNDLTTPLPEQIQTMYAMRDGSLSTPATWAAPLKPRVKPLRKADPLTTGPLAGAVPDGWYMDMPAGQRIVIDPEADLNVVAWIATSVQPDPCLTSLPAYVYAREYATAESDIQTFDILTGKWTTVASAYSATGAVGLDLIAFLDPASSFPSLGIGITQETSGVPLPYKVQPKSFGGSHRMSWRMLGN